MSSVEKVSNCLGDRKEKVVTMPFFENKLSTKDVDKGTDELADTPFWEKISPTKDFDTGTDELVDMKKSVFKILRKGLDKFEGQSKGSTGWFKLDSG